MNIEQIRTFIRIDILNDESVEIGLEDDLLLSETLDSLGVTRLVGYIEREGGIEVPAEDVTLENFGSLAQIEAYLATRRS